MVTCRGHCDFELMLFVENVDCMAEIIVAVVLVTSAVIYKYFSLRFYTQYMRECNTT